MFTLEQIKLAHSKIKSGADFPKYIQELKQLGVSSYTTYVSDGHVDYLSENKTKLTSPPKYDPRTIEKFMNFELFIKNLKDHQQGKTDFLTFIHHCAQCGIEKWVVSINKMTCTYYDGTEKEALMENIPA